ncbi:hypothetical protein GCM10023237_68670 [Streptomyces coeruleoprunus]
MLACAVMRPFGRPEAVVAVPAAGLLIATQAIPLDDALDEVERLGPVVGFLAARGVLDLAVSQCRSCHAQDDQRRDHGGP